MIRCCAAVARQHSQDMADRGFFDHVDPDGADLEDRLRRAGFTGDPPHGENIAAGASTAAAVVEGWMGSVGHCENIMRGAFAVGSIGYVEGPGGPLWTQVFAGSAPADPLPGPGACRPPRPAIHRGHRTGYVEGPGGPPGPRVFAGSAPLSTPAPMRNRWGGDHP